MAKHLTYGGSTVKRTIECTGWVAEAAKAPKIDRAGAAANQGSALHECMESVDLFADWSVIQEQIDACEGRHFDEFDYAVDTSDLELLETATKAALKVFKDYNVTEYTVEEFVQYADDVGGSADVIAVGEKDGRRVVIVLDWKFGYKIVDASMQGAFYALCGAATPELADIFEPGHDLVAVTVQPKVTSEPYVVEFDAVQRQTAYAKILNAIEASRSGNGVLRPGEHCEYCPAAPYCTAKREQVSKFLALSLEQAEHLSEAMGLVEQMKTHIKAIESEVFAALENDEHVPGWKLVEKQKRRYWKDEGVVEEAMRRARVPIKDFCDTKIKSVAQLEKWLKANRPRVLDKIADQIDNRSSGTTIAPESDKRPAVPGKNHVPDALADLMDRTG